MSDAEASQITTMMTANECSLSKAPPALGADARLWTDHNHRREVALDNQEGFVDLLCYRFPLVSRYYVERYLEHLVVEHHIENPLCERYLEAELGVVEKYREFIRDLVAGGLHISGKSCLDIGCSNGALLLACLSEGAASAMGIDVSPARLESAEILCAESEVELACVDIVTAPLAEKFDVIFCTDVLEHVESAESTLRNISSALRADETAFAYVSVGNRNFMPNVLDEPHYSVPGLIRLAAKDGQRIWNAVRSAYHSQSEYEVCNWYDYSEYVEMAERHGLTCQPCYREDTIRTSCAVEMAQYEESAARFEREFAEKRHDLPLPDADLQLLDSAAAEYVEGFRQDHASRIAGDLEATRRLFFKYYAQPIAFVLTHNREIEEPAEFSSGTRR